MTCYEILAGGVPLNNLGPLEYAAVYSGTRPIMPSDIDGWLKDLIERCWHGSQSERPDFKEIVRQFKKNCSFLSLPDFIH